MSFEILDEINDIESINSQCKLEDDEDDEWEIQQDKGSKTKVDIKYKKL